MVLQEYQASIIDARNKGDIRSHEENGVVEKKEKVI